MHPGPNRTQKAKRSPILNAPEKSSKVINPRAMEAGVMYLKRDVYGDDSKDNRAQQNTLW